MENIEKLDQVQPVESSEILRPWNRKRSTDELLGFIARREAALADLSDE